MRICRKLANDAPWYLLWGGMRRKGEISVYEFGRGRLKRRNENLFMQSFKRTWKKPSRLI